MKAYTFVNSYICGIQVGIQAGHSIVELMTTYKDNELVREWSLNHKTFVWLDGGDADGMQETLNLLIKAGLPYEFFMEPGLGNMITAVSVVLPTRLVEAADHVRQRRYHLSLASPTAGFYDKDGLIQMVDKDLSKSEMQLVELIAGSRNKQ